MSETDMKVDPARASALISQLQSVNERIAAVAEGRAVRSKFIHLLLYFKNWTSPVMLMSCHVVSI
jgi:hypothetical protein